MGYKTTLCDVSLDGGHYGIAAPAVDFKPGLPAYLRITDINDDGTLNPSDRKSVDDSSAGNYLLHEGDIVFARTGNSTGRNYYYDPRDGEYAYAGFLIKFSLDPRKINPRYMKYYAQSKQYWDWVSSFNTGSTRGNINAKTYASMPIDLLSRQIQDGIVAIGDAIDDKIRINRQLNNHLSGCGSFCSVCCPSGLASEFHEWFREYFFLWLRSPVQSRFGMRESALKIPRKKNPRRLVVPVIEVRSKN